ncbi:MAG: DUF4386 family protein [Anaerolineales bacterium]|nr:DUF4386 family protein [Anaerolineales bacterium]
MNPKQPASDSDRGAPEPKWRDLYRIGFAASAAFPTVIAVAVLVYFIWPYTPGRAAVSDVFAALQADRLGGLLSLDLMVPILLPVMALSTLALYAALKRVNESYALIALAAGLLGVGLWFAARPVAEMAYLSDQYSAAEGETARLQYLAAGEALHALFNGTNWIASQFLITVSSLISSLLMLRSRSFSRATAWTGILLSVVGLGFFLPAVGVVLTLAGTAAGIAWYILMARDFYRLGWGNPAG